jgi:hypothetical protein
MTEQANTELALPTITPEQYPALYVSGGLDPYYQQIRNQVLSEVPDLSTKKGIARVKSLASMVSSSKVAIEKPGREYLKQLKEIPKVIEAELRDWNQKMDALRDEVRQPVTELEEKEKARIAALDLRLNEIHQIGSVAGIDILPSETITAWIGKLDAIAIDATWDEYKGPAQVAKEAAKVKLSSALQNRLTWEAQQAEIARLKAEQEEKDRIQREKEIADRARHEAEQKALREKLESEQREQAAKDAAARAEREAVEAKERLVREQQESAERERQAAERAAEQERQRQIDEQNRIAQEEAQRKAEADAKAANVEHRRQYNREVIAAMQTALPNLSEQDAITLLTAIVQQKVPHLTIQY